MNHPRVYGVCENEMNETDADVPDGFNECIDAKKLEV